MLMEKGLGKMPMFWRPYWQTFIQNSSFLAASRSELHTAPAIPSVFALIDLFSGRYMEKTSNRFRYTNKFAETRMKIDLGFVWAADIH